MRKIIKWGIIISVSALVIWLLTAYYRCNKKGEKSGGLFECNPFSAKPCFMTPEEVRYKTREGKCYEITDYGKKMSYREVDDMMCREYEEV